MFGGLASCVYVFGLSLLVGLWFDEFGFAFGFVLLVYCVDLW